MGGVTQYVENITLTDDGGAVVIYLSGQVDRRADPQVDLTPAVEREGRWIFQYKTHRLTIQISDDVTEPYSFTPSNPADVAGFVAAWRADPDRATEPIRSALVDGSRPDRFTRQTGGAGVTIREGADGTVESVTTDEDPKEFANEVTIIGSAPQVATTRETFTGDGSTTSWPLAHAADSVTSIDVVDADGTVTAVESFGAEGDAWSVDTDQSRLAQRTGDTPLAVDAQVRVVYAFHLPVIAEARSASSIALYGLSAVREETPELDTLETVSARAQARLDRHNHPTQILDIRLRPGITGPGEGHGVTVDLPRHGITNEVWLVEEVEIAELESQLLQWRLTLLQRDHESLYAQSWRQPRIQPSEPASLILGIGPVTTGPERIGLETDLFSANLGGSHFEPITSDQWTDLPGGAIAQLHGAVFGTSAVQWKVTAKLVQPASGAAVTAQIRLLNSTTGAARGASVTVSAAHADFYGSARIALDDSVNKYRLQGRIVQRDVSSDSNYAAGLYVWAGEFVRPTV